MRRVHGDCCLLGVDIFWQILVLLAHQKQHPHLKPNNLRRGQGISRDIHKSPQGIVACGVYLRHLKKTPDK